MKNINQKPFVHLIVLFSIGLLFTNCSDNKTNWPQFRGPDCSMVVSDADLPTEWGDSLNIRWKQPMQGESWSSPIISGDKVLYSSSVLLKKAPVEQTESDSVQTDQNKDNQLKNIYQLKLTCLNLKTGNELWSAVSFEGNPKIKKHAASTYACETPVTDGKYVFVYYGMHGVFCYDMEGNLIWNKEIGTYETQRDWGTGASPTLHNNVLYIQNDNEENSFIVALDAITGDEKWRKTRDEKTTYSTPVVWKNEKRTELVTLGATARSYNPVTGDLLWVLEIGKGTSIPSPVFNKQYIYIGNAGSRGKPGSLFAVKAGAEGDITLSENETTSESVIWSDSIAGTGNPSPVLYNGLIYLLASRGGEIRCIDASNGELVYKQKTEKVGACWATPWIYNEQLYFYDEKGITNIIKTGREFEAIGSNSIDDKFWASVAIAKDAYIFKGVDNIYCVGN